ncbi:hypothetical protein SAMN05880501_105183 [Ureibacillus xyleni]|uniref:Uncharacterized protein n=1 Tax=Ureibacillus xyleni TaxID=614648 RepID=A0A285SS74_9BACL|nr:hypothetical protein [Ureibacillus xyleni]SOC09129.1 hypothetical protein SAMN05880501_105183 [Ureibacillus xyleni]
MEEEFIKKLLKALEHKKVQKAIQKIVQKEDQVLPYYESQEKDYQIQQLTVKLQQIHQDFDKVTYELQQANDKAFSEAQKVAQLNHRINQIEGENNQLKLALYKEQQSHDEWRQRAEQAERSLIKSQQVITHLESRFVGAEAAFSEFLQLTAPTRLALQGIFKGYSIDEFLYCGIQHENIEPLWEYIKREILEDRVSDIACLVGIFNFFFEAHNKVYDQPLFERLSVLVGDSFDEQEHIRGTQSKVSGMISEVLFIGFRNKKTNKIIKKSIVRV